MSDKETTPTSTLSAIKPPKNLASTLPKVKVTAAHPKYSVMIIETIEALKERGGSSRQAILKHISANYSLGDNSTAINSRLKSALRAGVADGSLKQTNGTGASGSFRLSEKTKKLKTAKVAEKKPKKTAEKPKSPKKTAEKSSKKTAANSPKKTVAKAAKKTVPKSPKGTDVESPKKAALKKIASKSPKKTATKSPKKSASKSPKKTAKSPRNTSAKHPKKVAVKRQAVPKKSKSQKRLSSVRPMTPSVKSKSAKKPTVGKSQTVKKVSASTE